jgi:hypothetical protein
VCGVSLVVERLGRQRLSRKRQLMFRPRQACRCAHAINALDAREQARAAGGSARVRSRLQERAEPQRAAAVSVDAPSDATIAAGSIAAAAIVRVGDRGGARRLC